MNLLLTIFLSMTTLFNTPERPSYLALGDSYTIGTNVKQSESFPMQLSRLMRWNNPKIIAQNGWQTRDLIRAMSNDGLEKAPYDHISILIGVNNQFGKGDIEVYKEDLRSIISYAVLHSKRGIDGVFAVSIPDYTVTPFGKNWGRSTSSEIAYWNKACADVCTEMGIKLIDITSISLKGENDPSYLAEDELHPSGKMYGEWALKTSYEL